MTDDLEHLLAVQDLDTSITQLQHRRARAARDVGPRRGGGAAGGARGRAGRRGGAARRAGRDPEGARGSRSPSSASAAARIEQRMYAATSSSGRDLQAMNDEVRHLTERRAELEELELVAMLDQEPIDAELAALRERAAPLEAQADELRGQVAEDQVGDRRRAGRGAGRPGGRGGAAPDRARRPLRDAAGPAEGHGRGAPGRQPLRRLPSRAVLGGGREDPRPSSRTRWPPASSAAASSSRPEGVIVLILVRHGESVANAQGLLLGRTDAELTETGRAQALAARALVYDPVAEVRSSPLQPGPRHRRAAGAGPARRASTSAGSRSTTASSSASRWATSRPRCGSAGSTTGTSVPRAARPWPRWTARVGAACEELFAADGAGARRHDGDVVVVSHVSPIKAAVAWALGTVRPVLAPPPAHGLGDPHRVEPRRADPARLQRGGVGAPPRRGATISPCLTRRRRRSPTSARRRAPARTPSTAARSPWRCSSATTTSPSSGPCTTSGPGPGATTARATSTSWSSAWWCGGPT